MIDLYIYRERGVYVHVYSVVSMRMHYIYIHRHTYRHAYTCGLYMYGCMHVWIQKECIYIYTTMNIHEIVYYTFIYMYIYICTHIKGIYVCISLSIYIYM